MATAYEKYKQALLDIMPSGFENALNASEIVSLIGGDSRGIRWAVEDLRVNDMQDIASGNYGYFLARTDSKIDQAELRKCINRLRAQANRMTVVADALDSRRK